MIWTVIAGTYALATALLLARLSAGKRRDQRTDAHQRCPMRSRRYAHDVTDADWHLFVGSHRELLDLATLRNGRTPKFDTQQEGGS
jgi:hypothetical protein